MNCSSITNPADVVRAVQDQQLNTTNYATECDNFCTAMLGTGNPDISGPGMMIAYNYETALTCVACLSPLYSLMTPSRPSRLHILINKTLRKLRKAFMGINAFYSMTLLVAAVVRFNQMPPILEIYIAANLNALQMFIIYSMICCLLYESFFAGCYGMRSAGWFVGTAMLKDELKLWIPISLPKSARPIYRDVARLCHEKRAITDFSFLFGDIWNPQHDLKWQGLLWVVPFVLTANFSLFHEVALVLEDASAKVQKSATTQDPKVSLNSWRSWPSRSQVLSSIRRLALRIGYAVIPMLALLHLPILLNRYLAQLTHARDTVKQISGDQFHDNEWGYGQTTAVLLLLPFAWKVLVESIKLLKAILTLPSDPQLLLLESPEQQNQAQGNAAASSATRFAENEDSGDLALQEIAPVPFYIPHY